MRHGLIAASELEAHRVLRRCCGHDDLGVTGAVCDQFQVDGQSAADAGGPKVLADVEICELCDRRADVWHDHSDTDKPFSGECTTSNTTPRRRIAQASDDAIRRMLTFAARIPRGRVHVPRRATSSVPCCSKMTSMRSVRSISPTRDSSLSASSRISMGGSTPAILPHESSAECPDVRLTQASMPAHRPLGIGTRNHADVISDGVRLRPKHRARKSRGRADSQSVES